MSYESILLEVGDGIATVTLNRPDKLNAYTVEMGEELVDAFRRVRDDEAVRTVLLTGAGRSFCAGVDLDHLKARQAGGHVSSGPQLGEEDFLKVFPLEMVQYPKPIIAAVRGHAVGVGVTMLLPCDIRIAADDAKLGLTFVKLGILPGLGSTHLLPRIVGRARALELVTTGRVVKAAEALEMGLVNRVVAGDALLETARELAGSFAEARPEVLAAAKRSIHYGQEHTMEEAMRNEERSSAGLRKPR
jgi:2-(1,2-epoxy-1,2-dihydrophenyl)acetyl-CoA isomerase